MRRLHRLYLAEAGYPWQLHERSPSLLACPLMVPREISVSLTPPLNSTILHDCRADISILGMSRKKKSQFFQNMPYVFLISKCGMSTNPDILRGNRKCIANLFIVLQYDRFFSLNCMIKQPISLFCYLEN